MNSETLEPTVNYYDFVGMVAADHHDQRLLNDLLSKHGIDADRFFVIGVQVRSGETRNNEVALPQINLLTVDMKELGAGSIDFIRKYAENNGNTLPYQRFPIELSFSELLDYFKSFDLVLRNRQLESVNAFEEIEPT